MIGLRIPYRFNSRSAAVPIFWILVGCLTMAYCLLLPSLLLPRKQVLAIIRSYLAIVLLILRALFGVRWEIIGDLSAAKKPVLVAAKHQSTLETLILQYELVDPVIILKRELLSIPIVGWVLRRLGHIGVDRSGNLDAARQLLASARKAKVEGRPLLIFPEGSRRAVGAPPDYKSGIDLLYSVLKIPCIPVAVNSGRVWPAKSLLPGSGRVAIEFLAEIEPGLPRDVFGSRLQGAIEEGTARLLLKPKL